MDVDLEGLIMLLDFVFEENESLSQVDFKQNTCMGPLGYAIFLSTRIPFL